MYIFIHISGPICNVTLCFETKANHLLQEHTPRHPMLALHVLILIVALFEVVHLRCIQSQLVASSTIGLHHSHDQTSEGVALASLQGIAVLMHGLDLLESCFDNIESLIRRNWQGTGCKICLQGMNVYV